jgi:hypothetical protein
VTAARVPDSERSTTGADDRDATEDDDCAGSMSAAPPARVPDSERSTTGADDRDATEDDDCAGQLDHASDSATMTTAARVRSGPGRRQGGESCQVTEDEATAAI